MVHAKKIEEKEESHVEPVLLEVSTAKTVKERARFGQDLCTLGKKR